MGVAIYYVVAIAKRGKWGRGTETYSALFYYKKS